MEFDRETIYQILISLAATLIFTGATVAVSLTFGSEADGNAIALSEQGGIALVGVIGLFIVIMALTGFWLERQNFDSEP